MNKTCRSKTCTETNPQPVTNFVKDNRYKDGYQNRCKTCQKKYDAERFLKKRDVILQQSKDYYASNLEMARAKRALWREMNRAIKVNDVTSTITANPPGTPSQAKSAMRRQSGRSSRCQMA